VKPNQEFNHAIEKLMTVNEKQLGGKVNGNEEAISNSGKQIYIFTFSIALNQINKIML